jgi:hypothetical protein
MTEDNDWGFVPRLIKEGEVIGFPKTNEPNLPGPMTDAFLTGQIEEEWFAGHPAYKEPEPDYEPIDTGTYDD